LTIKAHSNGYAKTDMSRLTSYSSMQVRVNFGRIAGRWRGRSLAGSRSVVPPLPLWAMEGPSGA
jgi:hypothetical protein